MRRDNIQGTVVKGSMTEKKFRETMLLYAETFDTMPPHMVNMGLPPHVILDLATAALERGTPTTEAESAWAYETYFPSPMSS